MSGKKICLLGGLVLAIACPGALSEIVVDDFASTPQGPLVRSPADVGVPISSSAAGSGMIGGERDITVLLTAATSLGITVLVDPFLSYVHSSGTGAIGTSTAVWDGVDGSATVDFVGLGGIDFTQAGTQDSLMVAVESVDLPSNLVFTVYTDAANFSTYTLVFPGAVANDVYVIPFSSFSVGGGAGANFANVGAVSMLVDGTVVSGLDLALDSVRTAAQIVLEKTDAQILDVDGDGNVDVGDRIKYTITITNPDDDGNLAALGVVFNDTPDPSTGLFVGSVTTSQGTVTTGNTGGDTSVSVNVGNIADGASVTIMFEVTVTAEDPLVCNQGFAGTIPSDDPETVAQLDPTCTVVTFCGDGIVNDVTEQCDDGNLDDHDACSNNCTQGCGNTIYNTGESCDGSDEAPGVDCTLPCRDPMSADSCTCCGDDILQPGSGEQCDGAVYEPGAPASAGPCRNDCTFCGDGIVNGGEECDDGNASNDDDCTNACATARCGDGFVDNQAPGVEQCDDGNMNDNDACTNACTTARCGDGIVQAGVEECDDGNVNDNDACTNACNNAECGDGIVQAGVEECDDGNMNNADDCTNACNNAECGDGFVDNQPPNVEQCDDGNMVNDDACTNACTTPRCGDGITQAGEQCDDGNLVNNDACTNACTTPRCGDGILQAGEQCDDGNNTNGDGCQANCMNPRCGDAIVDPGEACDDGNLVNNDGCTNGCALPTCGDGITQAGEQCDDGNLNNNDDCTNNCTTARCGDSFVQGAEQCDDGNVINDDGCTNLCTLPRCGDNIQQNGEQCDGNDADVCQGGAVCLVDCTCGPEPGDDIPTVNEWGLVILALLLGTMAKVQFGAGTRRDAA